MQSLALDEIRKALPASNYGHKNSLWNKIYRDETLNCPVVDKKRGECTDGYDCIDASIWIKNYLDERNVSSSIHFGKSEDGIFFSKNGHYFVETEESIIDGTPLYNLRNAKHISYGSLLNNTAFADVVALNQFMLDFRQDKGIKYLMRCSVEGCEPSEVSISALSKNETPSEIYEITASVNATAIRRFLSESSGIERSFSDVESIQRLGMLKNAGAIKLAEIAADCTVRSLGNLEYRAKSASKVSDDLSNQMDKNIKEFVRLVETVTLL